MQSGGGAQQGGGVAGHGRNTAASASASPSSSSSASHMGLDQQQQQQLHQHQQQQQRQVRANNLFFQNLLHFCFFEVGLILICLFGTYILEMTSSLFIGTGFC